MAYELTEFGRELEDIVLGLARWGARAPGFSPGGARRPDDALFAAKASYAAADDEPWPEAVDLRLGDEAFELRLGTRLEVRRVEARDADLALAADPQTFVDLLFRVVSPADAIASRAATTDGDSRAVERFLAHFEPLFSSAGEAGKGEKRPRRASRAA